MTFASQAGAAFEKARLYQLALDQVVELQAARVDLAREGRELERALSNLVRVQEEERSRIAADVHDGPLPPSKGFVEVLTPNVGLACLKRAEDSDALIVRLYEMAGKETVARVRLSDLVTPDAPCVEVDILEQPLTESTARMSGDTLEVHLPGHAITTVLI